MGAVLTVGTAEKAAGDRIRLPMDFGNEPLLIQGYTISSYTVTSTGTGAPTISGAQLDYAYQVSALVSAGTAGATYYIVYSITLNDPDATIIQRTGAIRIL